MKRGFCVFLLVLAGLSLTIACGDSAPTGESTQYLVRVRNLRAAAITVQIGPADYGTVAPQTTTDYEAVDEGDNTVLVNGSEAALSPANFAEGLPGIHHWTYSFLADGGEEFVYDDL